MITSHVLHLTEKFRPLPDVKTIEFEKFTFPGGESHLKIKDPDTIHNGASVTITCGFRTMSDILDIVLATDALRRLGVVYIGLFIPYFPAARQDRVCVEGEPLTVKVVADIINSCNFFRVGILTPHSDVTPALINNVKVFDECDSLYLKDIINNLEKGFGYTGYNIIIPDAGAAKRCNKIAQQLSNYFPDKNINTIQCNKVRNVATGELTSFDIQCGEWNGYPSIVVDDICAKGGTFIGIANALKQKGFKFLHLYTTHIDCEEGIHNVCKHYDCYHTTNSKMSYPELEKTLNFHQIYI